MTDTDNNTKVCNKCKQLKDKSHFSPDKRSKDGCQPSCKECLNVIRKIKYEINKEHFNKRQRDYYKNNKEKVIAINNKSKLKNIDKILAGKKAWYQKVKSSIEWQDKCKEYRINNKENKKQYDIKYRALNQEKCLERATNWRKNNKEKRKVICFNYDAKRRVIEKDGDSFSKINNWLKRQIKVCHWCMVDCNDSYHIDHYEPLSKGGTHTIDNLVIACPTCNLTKNAKDPYKFALTKGKLF